MSVGNLGNKMESHLNSSTMHQVETVCQQASIEAPSHHASEHTANEECYEPQGQPEQPDNTSVLPSEALLPEQCQHSREFTSLSQDAVVPVYNVGLNDELSDTGLTNERAAELREVFGPNSVKSKQTPEWQKVAKRYLRTTPILLTISAIMSVCIKIDGKRDWLSFSLLVFLCNVMVWADYMGERTAANAISAVEKLAAPECSAKRDGVWSSIEVVDLVPGDVVWLKAGMIVPADGVFIPHQKYIFLDESALTGESLAVKKCRGAELLSGSVVQRGEGSMLVQKTGVDSFYGKTIALLARADRKGHLRTILDSASKALTLAAVIFALFLVFWERFHPAWIEKRNGEVNLGLLLKRAFTLIAAVIPAAMPVVTTTVLAVGAVSMSREHAVVSRLSAIEEAAGVEILCTDKTGTLTLNKLTLSREDTSVEPGFTTNQLLVYASLATSCTEPDPIDLAINAEANMQERAEFEVLDYTPFNPVDKRADSIVRTKSGEVLFVTKGAPHVIGELVCAPGDTMKLQRLNSIIEDKARRGLRTLGVAIKPIAFKGTEILEEATEALSSTMWELVGFLCLRDPPRADTRETLERSKQMGVQIKMLTGDQRAIAAETARLLGLGDNICGPEIFKERPKGLESDLQFDEFISKVDGFSGVYPEHKFDIVDTLQRSGCLVAMTGDGVNDAPALKRATVGIAVSGATEAARAAADITLLSPGLSSIITVLSLSRQIFKRIEAYITFRIHGSVMTLLFWWGCVVIFDYEYPTWVLALVAIINDFVLMSCSRDNVPSSSKPLIWSMVKVSSAAIVTATLMAMCMLLYIYLSDPAYGVNWWKLFNLDSFSVAEVTTGGHMPRSLQTSAAIWLLFTLCIQLSFHSCRTNQLAFVYGPETRIPSIIVLTPQVLAVVLTLFLSVYWKREWRIAPGPSMLGISWGHAGITIIWSLLWFLITDVLKVMHCRYAWPYIARWEAACKRRFSTVSREEQQFRGKARAIGVKKATLKLNHLLIGRVVAYALDWA
ncbi:tubulin delta [Cyclospora cayetanensis]|uniref:Plasma membrane ATPase n=1 Tax=Cyclospora cayetanensis TaxID=88456 RepID=A0A1D3D2Q2_9EIME|nr:tubulin delta [Cyclospora cayetanensis]